MPGLLNIRATKKETYYTLQKKIEANLNYHKELMRLSLKKSLGQPTFTAHSKKACEQSVHVN